MAPKSDLTLSFAIDKAKLDQATKGVTTLQKNTKDLDKQLQVLAKTAGTTGAAVASGLKRVSASQVEMRNELLKGTKALQEQETVLDRYKQKLNSVSGAKGGGIGSTAPALASAVGGSLSAAGLGEIGGLSTGVGQAINAFRQLQQLAPAAASGTTAVASSFGSIAVAGPLVAAAMIALGVAIKSFMERIEAGRKMVSNAVEGQRTYYELIQTGTTESIKAGLAELKVKQAVAQQVRADIQRQIDQQKQQFGIVSGLITLVTGLDEEFKKADEEASQLGFQIDAYTRALGSNEVKARDAAKATQELTNNYAAAFERAAQQEAEILQRAADRRVEIAKRAAQQEQDALTSLRRSLEEGRLKLEQAQADARLNFQRTEAQAAKQHFNSLKKIRKDAQDSEFELVLNRDFAGLAKLRRETDKRLGEEDEQYLDQRRSRLTAFKQQQQDQAASFIRERQARITAYSQQLQDLRSQQTREIQANNEAANVELTRLRERLMAELNLKASANSQALTLEQLYQQARLRLLQQSVSSAGSTSGATGSTGAKHLAAGGLLSAGQTALVNEGYRGQRESFVSGGRSMMLPGGMGLFTPMRSGRVDSGGDVTVPISLTVNGSTWAEIRRQVHASIDTQLARAFEALTA